MEQNYASYLNHPVFKVISAELKTSNIKAFVIGGFVRDLILGNKSKDIDIVVQGDAWDGVMIYAPWLSKVGAIAYSFLLEFNVVINFFRRLFKKGNWSLAKYLKHKVKNAVKYIGDYEKTLATFRWREISKLW